MSLNVRRNGDVCELRLASPPGNIIDRAGCESLTAAIREHSADTSLKAILFTGEGDHFSYGASVPEHVAGEVEEFLPAFHAVFDALIDASLPTIAVVRGFCLGGGFELAAFCSHVFAARNATFSVPEIKLGVLPPVACAVLPWRVGGAVAEDLILSGRDMSAEEGFRVGLVQRVCDDDKLDETVEEWIARTIRPRSAAVLRLATKATRAPLFGSMRYRIGELERLYLEDLMGTKDANEGIAAFLEKRKPAWVNG
ncbi:MAG: enoyl-CoA hydratase/isomerase family protein [Planctomycetota bacterium]|jgi:cyclohexa-1,5-dienecarbonyl-CoA hydratase